MNITHRIFRATVLVLALFMILTALPACVTVKKGEDDGDDRPYIVCTVFPQYDFIKNIAGDRVKLEMLVPPGTDTHNFGLKDISISKLNQLSDADLIVFVGGESDEKLREELTVSLKGDTEFLTLLSLVDKPLTNTATGGMEAEESKHEDEHGHDHEDAYDEHVWTSPKRAIELVDGLTSVLTAIDPAGKDIYKQGAIAYKSKLMELNTKFETLKNTCALDTLIFADRYPFRYLCTDYGINADAAFSGCSSSVEPSLSTLDYLYKKAKDLKVPAILYMEGSDPSYAQSLAEKIDGQALLLHSCHVVSEEEFGKMDYIALMEQNLSVLKIALGAD